MKPDTFQLQTSKVFPKKPALKKFFCIFSKKPLIFRKWKPPKKISYISGNENPKKVLMFQETKLLSPPRENL